MINSCHIFQLISFEHQQLLWLTDRRMHGNVQLTQNQNKIQTDHYNSRQVVSRTNKNTHHMHCTQRRLQIYFQTKLPTSVIQSSSISMLIFQADAGLLVSHGFLHPLDREDLLGVAHVYTGWVSSPPVTQPAVDMDTLKCMPRRQRVCVCWSTEGNS